MLRAGVALNGLENIVDVREAAASLEVGEAELARFQSQVSRSLLLPHAFSRDARDFAGLHGSHTHELPYERVPVSTVRLADLLAGEQHIHLLKLDVESHEVFALLGLGDEMLRKVDAIIFEFRAWALEDVTENSAMMLLEMLDASDLFIMCHEPCIAELKMGLHPGETVPDFLGTSFLHRKDFPTFVELALRLRQRGRDFDMFAIRAGIARFLAQRLLRWSEEDILRSGIGAAGVGSTAASSTTLAPMAASTEL
eukprot:gnl/TRDRNA2_/TRDRNA2_157600_c1_seq1.p1 gnl/TRDRNA2_/TRDRNA2_157600_c1~~gnl/TRDRNA2_/TRDRNA2_157600_c1_seq1.p1  ORF type:complete len:254 (-),score=54.03 gnl/TRDRNA2_/TRDRNA2_157600_c1_seq1:12-773(-)